MQVKVFKGDASVVEVEFNEWMKGKGLSKDVLIQTDADGAWMFIWVFYPDGMWEKPPEKKPDKAEKVEKK